MIKKEPLIVILGPTATGKTELAAVLAYQLNAEIISADSRQVYKYMDVGTGKDLSAYFVNNKQIPYHLINLVEPVYEFNLFEFISAFNKVYNDIVSRGKKAILCGGTGLYLHSVLKGYHLHQAPVNIELRKELEAKTDDELINMLGSLTFLHNKTDIEDRKRLIRALEIELQKDKSQLTARQINSIVFGIHYDREIIRERITARLRKRLQDEAMIEEVENLLNRGVTEQRLKSFGLEYKYITMYLMKEINYQTMFEKLNTAIHQFAKRQMTWFRKIERETFEINWIDGNFPFNMKIDFIINTIKQKTPY